MFETQVTENSKPLKPFGVFAVTKRSLCYSSKNKSDKNDNTLSTERQPKPGSSHTNDESPSVSDRLDDLETRRIKSKESEMLMNLYQSAPAPSTSDANLSDRSDDSFDLDKYREVKRTKCSDEEFDDSQRSEYEEKEKQIVSDSDPEMDQNIALQVKEKGDEWMDETVPEHVPQSCKEESDISENFESTRKSSERDTKSPLRSRSVPLKGLKFIQKKSKDKNNPTKKKFLDQKTKISHFFSPSQN